MSGRIWVRAAISSTSIWTAFCSCLFESAGVKTTALLKSSICTSAAKAREAEQRRMPMKNFMNAPSDDFFFEQPGEFFGREVWGFGEVDHGALVIFDSAGGGDH